MEPMIAEPVMYLKPSDFVGIAQGADISVPSFTSPEDDTFEALEHMQDKYRHFFVLVKHHLGRKCDVALIVANALILKEQFTEESLRYATLMAIVNTGFILPPRIL
jgi:hypothetical protein